MLDCIDNDFAIRREWTPIVTITDVAKRAGTSVATVSAVLNNSRPVNDSLRNRVIRAVEHLGYHPDPVARSLRGKSGLSIGLVFTDISNPFFPELTKSIYQVLNEAGYSIFLGNTFHDLNQEETLFRSLLAKRVDGLIIGSSTLGMSASVRLVQQNRIPFVTILRQPGLPDLPFVGVDNIAVGRLAAEHLLSLGHTQVALLSGPEQSSVNRDRTNGFRGVLTATGNPFDPVLYRSGPADFRSGYNLTQELLTVGSFSALFTTSDVMALGAMRAARDAGLELPRDLSIIGCDNIELASYTQPALTTVEQPIIEIGRRASDLLLRYIGGSAKAPETIILSPSLVIRESTSDYPGRK